MKTRPRAKIKLPKLVEIVPDMYSDLLFGDMSWKPKKSVKTGFTGLLFPSIHLLLQVEGCRGWQRVTLLTGIPSWFKCTCCANGQVSKIQVVPWFCNSTYTQKGRRPYLCLLFSYHSPLQTGNLPNQIFSAIVINLQQPGKVYSCT